MIQPIGRLDDPRISFYARVGDPAWLRDQGLFVAEGRFVVRRLFETARYEVDSILVTPTALDAMRDALPEHVTVYVAEQKALDSITGFNFHRGCLALVRRPRPLGPMALAFANALVALEGIGNPDNVGGIFRTAAAFGVEGVLLDPTSGDPLYRKAIRTSMGAALALPFARAEQWPGDLDRFKRAGFQILALTPHATARAIGEVTHRNGERWILMAGSEGPGLSQAVLDAADVKVRIPMVEGFDSLNVTVAIGIALSRLSPRGPT